ncbi:endopeptidase Clp [Hyphomonas oceanitis SCH89]|uniref:ATP-dependent Clp protease proteolytic subunit n=2 Tax=Hyphomonas oceanitis TaxID=81033 RepID=A0A059G9X7_9PROT|nr:endopeptidase Clp [Hyphomonas oceanitis SCH89]
MVPIEYPSAGDDMSPYSRLDDEEAESPPMGEPNAFLEEALFKARTILLTGGIDFKQAKRVCERLLALSSESDKPILLVISSPGGHVESGDMIHDMIKFVGAPVKILGTGWVASAGALIYSAAQKENRYALKNTRFLLHEPRGGVGGQATDVEIQAREIIKMRERLNQIFAEATGKSLDQIKKDTDRDFWMSAEEAVEYGLVNKIVTHRGEIK